jgi:hypothetical protein
MAFYPSTSRYRRIPMRDRRGSSDIAFVVWAPVILIGLAIVSIASGVAPVVDPTVFPVP